MLWNIPSYYVGDNTIKHDSKRLTLLLEMKTLNCIFGLFTYLAKWIPDTLTNKDMTFFLL